MGEIEGWYMVKRSEELEMRGFQNRKGENVRNGCEGMVEMVVFV